MSPPRAAIDAWLDGDAEAESVDALAAWLREDPEHRRAFVREVALERALRDAHALPETLGGGAPPASAPQRGATARRTRAPLRRARTRHAARPLLVLFAAAAAAAVVVGLFLVGRADRDQEVRLIGARDAQVVGADGAVIAAAGSLAIGDRLRLGAAGEARLVFPDGTDLRLAAGGELALVATTPAKRLELARGRLVAAVARQPDGQPLVVATPRGEALVRGTRFELEALPEATTLTVRTGLVTLRAGDAAVDVAAGRWALAAPAVPLRALPIGAGAFVLGVNCNGPSVVIDGERWRGHEEALAAGLRFAEPPTRHQAPIVPRPACDADTARMLASNVYLTRRPLALSQELPAGRYRLWAWVCENYADGARSFSLAVEGVVRAEGIGRDQRIGDWARLGPFDVDVADGALDLLAAPSADQPRSPTDDPHLMGFSIERLPNP